jgi:hypothetical protein
MTMAIGQLFFTASASAAAITYGDLMGDSVNIAARLEGIADPDGICLSEDAYRQVRDRCVRSRCLIILQEPLDVVELLLRTQHVAEAAAQLLDDAACALDVDLARHLHRVVVAVVAPAQRTAKRIGVLLRARLAEPGVAQALDSGIPGLRLAAVSARDAAKAKQGMSSFAYPVPILSLKDLAAIADIVVDAAPANALREIAEPALLAGRKLVVISGP